jgi:hypothetical protein
MPGGQFVAASSRLAGLHPTTSAVIRQQLARFCAVEQGIAAVVQLLKAHVADALGVQLTHPRARELYLVGYVPSGLCLMRTILRDALELGIRQEQGQLFLAAAGTSCEAPA